MTRTVDKPYNGGTWSSARYFGFIRSALRRASLRWGPKNAARMEARQAYTGENKRQRWEYQCAECHGWFAGKEAEVHHKQECGTLRAYTDLPGFVERLFCEKDGFEVLCVGCHRARKQ